MPYEGPQKPCSQFSGDVLFRILQVNLGEFTFQKLFCKRRLARF
jgi:hypothetical protein